VWRSLSIVRWTHGLSSYVTQRYIFSIIFFELRRPACNYYLQNLVWSYLEEARRILFTIWSRTIDSIDSRRAPSIDRWFNWTYIFSLRPHHEESKYLTRSGTMKINKFVLFIRLVLVQSFEWGSRSPPPVRPKFLSLTFNPNVANWVPTLFLNDVTCLTSPFKPKDLLITDRKDFYYWVI
jgi:hypothetical protein